MFEFDPIDLSDPAPYFALSYYAHIFIGILALLASLTAFAVTKGSRWHRLAGWTFMAALAVVCVTSFEMLSNVFIPPLFMAVFTALYAVGGAWLALRKGTRTVRIGEGALFVFEVTGLALFLTVAIEAVRQGIVPPFGPGVIAIIPLILLAGDINWFLKPDQRARLRLGRHSARMIWAFVVVLRAPLVEVVAAGLPIPQIVVIVGPIMLGIAMLVYFRRRLPNRTKTSPKSGLI